MAGKPDTAARTFGYLAGGAGLSVVLIYLAVNISAIRAFRTGFRDDFRFCRHLLISATGHCFPVVSPLGFFTRAAGP